MYCPLSSPEFEERMELVAETSLRVLRMQSVKPSEWRDRIYDVYQLCNSSSCMDNTPQIYEAVHKRIESYAQETIMMLAAHHDFTLVTLMEKAWMSFSKSIVRLDHLFNSYNKTINQLQNIRVRPDQEHYYKNLNEIGLSAVLVWRNMLSETGLTQKIIHIILIEIDRRRAGETVSDFNAIKRVLEAFHEMDAKSARTQRPEKKTKSKRLAFVNHLTYHEHFENPFLKSTAKYYSNESMELITESFHGYITRVWQMMNTELELMATIVMAGTQAKLARVVQECFVTSHEGAFRAHIPNLLKTGSTEDWRALYNVTHFTAEGPWLEFDKELQQHVTAVLMDKCTPLLTGGHSPECITCLLQEIEYFTNLGKTVFQSNVVLSAAIDKALQTIINKNMGGGPSTSDMLAKYIDSLIRKSDKFGDGIQETTIEYCMAIFRYLDDKDVFMKFYSHLLARRLIVAGAHSYNQELEERFIFRLKECCGHEFTSKLYRMITDKNLSRELASSFLTFLSGLQRPPALAPIVHVLQAGTWPISTSSQPPFDPPQELVQLMEYFGQFYSSKFNGRALHWHHMLSTGDVKTNFSTRPYQISMSLYQMVIVLLFNSVDSMTIEDITSRTKLTKEIMSGHVKTLVDSGLLLLPDGVKVTDWSVVDVGTVLSLNMAFKHKRMRFRLTATNVREAKEENAKTRSSAFEDRKIWLQAAIVRVMKARKQLSHQTLTQEVIEMCVSRFKPNVPLIKKSIESLLEKGFLARSADSHDMYVYVA